jgi:hypothetical protein
MPDGRCMCALAAEKEMMRRRKYAESSYICGVVKLRYKKNEGLG